MNPTAALEAVQRAAGTLACESVALDLRSDDAAAAGWLAEVLQPWFAPTRQEAEWRVAISSCPDAYAEWACQGRSKICQRACFAFDQQLLLLPTWSEDRRVVVADAERSCFLTLAPSDVRVFGDPGTRRWRMDCLWVFCEIAATRLRRTWADMHAAAVEHGGRAMLISGPKNSGKTTLLLHLLRSGLCRPIANDRAFVGCTQDSCEVRGMPTAVKIRPDTLAEFPELTRGLSGVTRPYLYSLDELAAMPGKDGGRLDEDFALSPAQFARRLQVDPAASAPLGAIVFPSIDTGLDGWTVERLHPREVSEAIRANRYGPPGQRTATIFEDLIGDASPSPRLPESIAESIPGYRVLLGRNAYGQPDFASRFLEISSVS